ncbi:MAG: UDP-3-O-acyl-N-acetylglucosamine deacetylase [Alphaproteobacteria bacterium]|nr:UDP-3-O-acyl-N-acetylglucosamine deacetylase [Alphaproteobacteria bacterium]
MTQSRNILMQHTIAAPVSCAGVSLHTGDMVDMLIKPAAENTGIVFVRRDVEEGRNVVPATYDRVTETTLGTTIANEFGVTVSTIEHVMAALWGAGIDNAIIEVDGPEVPIMDGSSEPFIFLIDCAGRTEQSAAKRVIEVLKPITVQEKESTVTLSPAEGFTLDITIDFPHKLINRQQAVYDFAATSFKQALCRARTFGFARDVEKMRSMGLALGGSLHNAIVLADDGILNEGGLRYNDEFVRHKALDCVGDYFLAGGMLQGNIETLRPGHGINNKLLRALFADPANYRIIEAEAPAKAQPLVREEAAITVAA